MKRENCFESEKKFLTRTLINSSNLIQTFLESLHNVGKKSRNLLEFYDEAHDARVSRIHTWPNSRFLHMVHQPKFCFMFLFGKKEVKHVRNINLFTLLYHTYIINLNYEDVVNLSKYVQESSLKAFTSEKIKEEAMLKLSHVATRTGFIFMNKLPIVGIASEF